MEDTTRTVAVFGGSFNPPGLHHRRIARVLAKDFHRVLVVPCGPRPDKPTTTAVSPVYRAAMVDMTFQDMERVEVDLFDLEGASFTRTHLLEERFQSRGEVWHVVGLDLVCGGGEGKSQIQILWEKGGDLWQNSRFVVFLYEGQEVDPADLPPFSRVVRVGPKGSSPEIRAQIFNGQCPRNLLDEQVHGYIERYGLYRLSQPTMVTKRSLNDPKLLVFADTRNPRAVAWAKTFESWHCPEDPNCILVIGGDGTMLAAIQEHWRRRLPFFGLNAGHLGFLLNDADEVLHGAFPPEPMVIRHLSMLYVEMLLKNGERVEHLAFNDAWVERSTGQSAWLEVKVNGEVKFPKLVCDGILASTAAGSTAYARSMGASPLLVDTPAWLLVGSNVMTPPGWKSALLSMPTSVEVKNLNPAKRPLRGFVNGVPLGEVLEAKIRPSRIASVELAFHPEHDVARKIAQLHFPG